MAMRGDVYTIFNHPQNKLYCVSGETKQNIRKRYNIAPAGWKIGEFNDKFCFLYLSSSCLSIHVRSSIKGREQSNTRI